MEEKTSKNIEKPWAVYGEFNGLLNIGKIIDESKDTCHIKSSSAQISNEELWDCHAIKQFESSRKAINYFWKNNPNKDYFYSKEKITKTFLMQFPEEKANLTKLLKQSSPKCTKKKQSYNHKGIESAPDDYPSSSGYYGEY